MRSFFKVMRRNLFIQSMETPNPRFLKFFPVGKPIMDKGTFDFSSSRISLKSPLARDIFLIDGVNKVFYGKDYISVGVEDGVEWEDKKPQVYEVIEEFFNSGEELFKEKTETHEENDISDSDSETVQLIKEIIQSRIRPVLNDDGGDVVFKRFDIKTGVVILELQGSCSGCPSSG